MKTVVIGGTGSLGTAIIQRIAATRPVVCFSRGEAAQKTLSQRFPHVEMQIGDVRDRERVREVVRDAETVFLLAAIKHIDVAESNPIEAVKTNVLGAVNVAEECLAAGVKHVVFSNTDKAVLPITTYGYTKALAQNYLLAQNSHHKTKFSVFNWGNIIASRGSAVPIFVSSLLKDRVVYITDPKMSRFWLRIETAADFMIDNYAKAPKDRALIPPVKGATVVRVIEACARILGITGYRLEVIGLRGVEKFSEVLESTHQGCLRSDTCEQYTDQELDMLLTDIVQAEAKRC